MADQKTFRKAFDGTLPSEIKMFRNEEKEYITQKLGPSVDNRRMENVHVYGKEGSGKSFLISSVTSELSESSTDLVVHRIDCRVHDTEYKVLKKVSNSLGEQIPRSGYSSTQARGIFKTTIPQAEKNVMVLDHVELLLERDGDKVFYFLSRLDTENNLPDIGVITASSRVATLNDALSSRVRSSYNYNKIELKSLDPEKMVKGLQNHFGKFGVGKEIIAEAVKLSREEAGGKTTNLRLAFNTLNELVEKYEKPFDDETIENAFIRVQRQRYNFLKAMLSKHEKLFLKAVRRVSSRERGVWSGATYKAYRKLCEENEIKPHSDRILGDYLTRISLLGFVTVEK